ncbi:MAG: DUF262 domain-containing protein, partial [Leptospiraceae bacterium]|nr:DUF262 domain-containing protein [Leptospiraceae bacterium]
MLGTYSTKEANTQSIQELINDIDKEIIYLPEFQRDFVWEISKTYDLFDSLARNIFIGAIIYGVPSFDIAVREIDHSGKRIKKAGKGKTKHQVKNLTKDDIEKKQKMGVSLKLILDGQQRVTAIYRALKGIDDVWFIAKKENEIQSTYKDATLEELLEEISGFQDEDR